MFHIIKRNMLQNDPTEALKNKDQVAVQSILDSRQH